MVNSPSVLYFETPVRLSAKSDTETQEVTMTPKIDTFPAETWLKRLQKAHYDPQNDLFGVIRDKRKEMRRLHTQVLTVQRELQKQTRTLFADRPPIPLTPFVMLPLGILYAKDLQSFDKILFATIFLHSSDKKTAWPSQTRLASFLGVSVRTIQRSLVRLVRKGYILIGIRWTSHTCCFNQYTLNLEDPRDRQK